MQLSMAKFFECLLVLQLNLSTTKFKVPETYMFSYYVTSGRGTSVIFGDVCTSKGLKTWTYLRTKLMKIGTPFKANTLDITLCSREKIKNSMNVSTLFRFCSTERLRIHVVQVSFNRSYAIHLAGHLCTAILSETIYIACLRITLGTQFSIFQFPIMHYVCPPYFA